MFKFVVLFFVALIVPMSVQAKDDVLFSVKEYIPNADLVGKGRLKYLMWQVYDATLYAPNGQYQKNKPVALSIHYLRSIKGRQIADKSAEEIRRQGFKNEVTLATWYEQMRRIFPDVFPGTVLTGIRTDTGQTIILKDGIKIGSFTDPDFAHYFFDILLGYNTSAPDMRDALLGKGYE